MTSPFSVKAEGVGKRFLINRQRQQNGRFRYRSLREEVTRMVKAPFRALTSGAALGDTVPFDALQDISFEIQPGETVGIIGRNGAGKSTLLKILSRITKPTSGQIRLRGRVGSLLEVGTGFHPELSGRDNIFLNGAILGMGRAEIKRKFDEIVAFAEVDQFLDTPVKRYSSGMYVRLAFAVAAHLEPEVLVVDEVLAVGDASFQKKCLNKMEDVGRGGRTVLFVSHNMPSITRLCQRSLLLDAGRLVADGDAQEVVGKYLMSGAGTAAERSWNDQTRPGNEIVRLNRVRLIDESEQSRPAYGITEAVGVELNYDVLLDGHKLVPNFSLYNAAGICAFASSDVDPQWQGKVRGPGQYTSTAWIPGNLLSEGTHFVNVAVSTMDPVVVHFHERDAVAFEVMEEPDKRTARGEFGGSLPGAVRPLLQWKNQFQPHSQLSRTGP